MYGRTSIRGPKHVRDKQENAVLRVVANESVHGRAMNHLPHKDHLLCVGEREVMREPEVHGIKRLRVPRTYWKTPYWNAINPLEPLWPTINTPVAVEVLYTGSQDFHLQSRQALQPLGGFSSLGLGAPSNICPIPRDHQGHLHTSP